MQRQYVHVGARTIAYFDSAPHDRSLRVLVLIHAFPLGAAMWEGQVKALPPGWRLIAPDLRGFGGSTIAEPDEAPTMDDYASDVIDLLHELELPAPVVGGLSMGGYVTLALLRRMTPRAVVFAATRASADSPEGRANRRGMLVLVDREGPSGVARDMMPRLLGATTREEQPEVEPLVRRLIKQQTPAAIRGAVLRMMERPASFDVVAALAVPAIIVVGEEDELTPVDDSRRMAEASPGARLVVVPRAGHLVNLEQPDAFNAAIRGFLGQL
ncbi:MAG: alpha/beta fold hydrolase [Acidobacteriota bacterium]